MSSSTACLDLPPTGLSASCGARAESAVLLVPDYSLNLASRLPRVFHGAGYAVDLLCSTTNPVGCTRYVRQIYFEPALRAVAHRLESMSRNGKQPWRRVVVTVEGMVRVLLQQAGREFLSVWQPGAEDPLVRGFLMDKLGLETARSAWNMPIPPSRVCQTFDEVQRFGAEGHWPIMVKAPDSSGGRAVLKIHNEGEALGVRAWMRFPCLAQKFIAGRMGVADLLCSRGRLLAWLACYGVKHTRGEFGPCTVKQFCAMPALAPLVQQVAECTRFEGFCGFDWIEEAGTGRHYLIEFHPRPTSGVRFGADCGVDFSAAVKAWLDGNAGKFATLRQPSGRAVVGHVFPYDVSRCLRERDWAGLYAWLTKTGVSRDIPWDDPAPVAALVNHWLETRFLSNGPAKTGAKFAALAKKSTP